MHTMTGSITVPRLPVRFIVVAAAHVGLIYLVSDALRFQQARASHPETIVRFLPEKPDPLPKAEPEQLTLVKTWELPEPVPPTPDYPEEVEPRRDSGPIHAIPPDPVDAPAFRGRVAFVPVRASADHPLTRAPYPAASIRLEEEGVVELAIHVLRNGRIADVKVARSSGHPRLDRAAVEEARRHWRLQPATQGGEPVDAWGTFRIVFRLDRR